MSSMSFQHQQQDMNFANLPNFSKINLALQY